MLHDSPGKISGTGHRKSEGQRDPAGTQYTSSKDELVGLEIAKNCILGKVHNAEGGRGAAVRDHSMQIDAER